MLARGGPIEPDAPFSLPTVAGAQQAPHFGSDLGHQREHARARLLIGLTDQLFEMVQERLAEAKRDRKSVVSGKSVSVRVDLGGRRIIKKKTNTKQTTSRKTT